MKSIHARGRDNVRTPMQWSAGENAGFTTGKPWVPVNENHTEINAEAALADENSIFHHYRKLIQLRKTIPEFRDGSFSLVDPEHEYVFAYTRDTETGHMLVVCNFTEKEGFFQIPEEFQGAEVLISNYEGESKKLRPYEAKILYRR